jgi:hypothetical protein
MCAKSAGPGPGDSGEPWAHVRSLEAASNGCARPFETAAWRRSDATTVRTDATVSPGLTP